MLKTKKSRTTFVNRHVWKRKNCWSRYNGLYSYTAMKLFIYLGLALPLSHQRPEPNPRIDSTLLCFVFSISGWVFVLFGRADRCGRYPGRKHGVWFQSTRKLPPETHRRRLSQFPFRRRYPCVSYVEIGLVEAHPQLLPPLGLDFLDYRIEEKTAVEKTRRLQRWRREAEAARAAGVGSEIRPTRSRRRVIRQARSIVMLVVLHALPRSLIKPHD